MTDMREQELLDFAREQQEKGHPVKLTWCPENERLERWGLRYKGARTEGYLLDARGKRKTWVDLTKGTRWVKERFASLGIEQVVQLLHVPAT